MIKYSVGILSFILISSSLKSYPQGIREKEKPNIILILADDLGYGDLGCFGQEYIKTPNLDKIAAEGIRFIDHYSGSSVCAPSRSTLMTGLNTGHTEVRGNIQLKPAGQLPLSNQAVTVAGLLQNAGYKTAMIGKWGLGIEGTSGEPNKQGFDYYYGYLDQVLAHNYFPEYLIRNGKKEMLDNEVGYLSKEAWHGGFGSYSTKKVSYSNDLFTQDALRFIDANKSNPFFLYLPYTIPHDNGEAPQDERMEVPDFGSYSNKVGWDNNRKGYAAMISRLDRYVGQVINKLKELDIEDNTLVIFTSDNGPEMSYECTQFFNSNGELTGGKRVLYEGGIKVPFIAWWPGKIEAGTESKHISAFWDFLPTACDVAGIKTSVKTHGISYLPTLLGKNSDQKKHECLYWEFTETGAEQAIMCNSWKLITFPTKNKKELYNILDDPGETNDIAKQNPGKVKELTRLMVQSHTKSDTFKLKSEK